MKYKNNNYISDAFWKLDPDFTKWLESMSTEPSYSAKFHTHTKFTQNEEGVDLSIDLPGVYKKDCKVSVTDDEGPVVVHVHATRTLDKQVYKYEQSFRFGAVDPDSVTALLTNGVLLVTALNKIPEKKGKREVVIE